MSGVVSNRGGKREGAGRKPGEGSTRVSVPNGCLDSVLSLILDYRSGAVQASTSAKPEQALEQTEIPFNPFPELPIVFVEANRRALEALSIHCEDLPALLQFLKKQKSGEFRRGWEALPVKLRLSLVKHHKTPEAVYKAGGRVCVGLRPMVQPMILWFDGFEREVAL